MPPNSIRRVSNALSLRRARATWRPQSSTHVDAATGLPTMVDIQTKLPTKRVALATSSVMCPPMMAHLFPPTTKLFHSAPRRASSGVLPGVPLTEIVTDKKGSVLATAIVAGTMGAKATAQLIPFCHPVPLEQCKFQLTTERLNRTQRVVTTHVQQQPTGGTRRRRWASNARVAHWHRIHVACTAITTHKTGVEMEALVGASVCALTIYDMLKGIGNAQQAGLRVGETRVVLKRGGKSDITALIVEPRSHPKGAAATGRAGLKAVRRAARKLQAK